MTRRYGETVQVTLAASADAGERDAHYHHEHEQHQQQQQPTSFTWRGRRYWVTVIGRWHLADRWWDATRHSDRRYYRVATADHQVFELYHDTVSGAWVLDIVHD